MERKKKSFRMDIFDIFYRVDSDDGIFYMKRIQIFLTLKGRVLLKMVFCSFFIRDSWRSFSNGCRLLKSTIKNVAILKPKKRPKRSKNIIK